MMKKTSRIHGFSCIFPVSLVSVTMTISLILFFKHVNDVDQNGVNFAFRNIFMVFLLAAGLVLLLLYAIKHDMKPDKKSPIECPFRLLEPGINLPLLVFDKVYDPSKFEPITNMPFRNKPKGGLWTSPFNPDTGSEWIEWCKNENFEMKAQGSPMTFIKVKDDGKFLVIYTLNDLIEVLKIFQLKGTNAKYFDPVLDYESLTRSIDGIYLTSQGQNATRVSSIEDPSRASLYGWDCETVFIMNKDVIENVLPGKIEAKWVDKIEDNIENFTHDKED